MKKILTILVTLLTVGATGVKCFGYSETLVSLAADKYQTKADSLNYCFIEKFLVKDKGIFKVHPEDGSAQWDIYWQQAHAMDVLIYAYERIKDEDPERAKEYKTYMQAWYRNRANNWGSSTTWENPFTDDMCWIGLTMYHMATALNIRAYFTQAKTIYDKYIASRKQTDSRGTFLPWNNYGEANSGPNACTLAPACLLALRLYDHYEEEQYLEDAKLYYNFMVNNICKNDGRVEEPPLTYTQGTFGEACRVLFHVTGERAYKTKAQVYLGYAINNNGRCVDNGILRHEGTSMDQSLFKAVLIPYLVNFVLDEDMNITYRKNILNFLNKNADTLWSNLDKEAYPTMYCPYYWAEPYDASEKASMGAMASGCSLMENVARLNKELLLEAAGIENVLVTEPTHNDATYDLQGRRLYEAPSRGLYIQGGRVIVR